MEETLQIRDRIAKLGKSFRKMEIVSNEVDGQQVYVAVALPSNWIVDERTEEKFGVGHTTDNGITFFWGALEDGENNVFDAIEYNIEQNRTAQEKANLFEEKVRDLQNIFTNDEYTIEQLRSLKIVVGENKFSLPVSTVLQDKKKKIKNEETTLNE